MKHHMKPPRFGCVEANAGAGTMPMLVLIITVILMLMGTVALKVTGSDMRAGIHAKKAMEVLYVAEAGLAHARSAMAGQDFSFLLANFDSSLTNRVTQDSSLRVFVDTIAFGDNGRYTVTVYDNDDGDGDALTDADGRIFVRATGLLDNGSQRAVEMMVARVSTPTIDSKGSIVASGPIRTLGTMLVDGRDHDLDGNLVGGGTLAISTSNSFDRGGNSHVAGIADDGTVIAPTRDAALVDRVTEEFSGDPEPDGPDEAIGLTPGSLEAIAKGGAGGSQYVTNPADLTFPLSGVTYVNLPCGSEWNPAHFGESGGILVVSNACKNASIKNLNSGVFKGIIIADEVLHIHNVIIGQIIQIVSDPPSKECIGNGTGTVLYSTIAIAQALASISMDVRMVAYREL